MKRGRTTDPGGAEAKRLANRAFTLIELLMAVVIFGIVLAAMNTVFYSSMRLRARTTEAVDESQALSQVLTVLRRDLQNIVPPGGVLAGAFKIGPVSTGANVGQFPGIEFRTATGVLDDTMPWGEVQKVIYQLRDPLDRPNARGKDLIRSVTRNLLATTTEESLARRLLTDVEALEFLGFTGTDWRATWDTTLSDTNLPGAIRVRLQMASGPGVDTRNRQPIELIVPLAVQVRTTQTTGGGQ